MILIISARSDVHARRVAQILQQCGHSVLIQDLSEAGAGLLFDFELPAAENRWMLDQRGQRCDFADIRAVWYRRPVAPDIAASVIDHRHRAFAQREWIEAFQGAFASTNALWVNDPFSQARAAHKLLQLLLAQKCGLLIPRTHVTNDEQTVRRFLKEHPQGTIHKVLHAPDWAFLETRKLEPGDLSRLGSLAVAPAIFQEEIRGPGDIRVTAVGDQLFSAFIPAESRDSVDLRLSLDVPYESFDLPRATHEKLLRLMAELGLVFSTIDLRLRDDGQLVFLEVNPQGQFLYVEIKTGLPISNAVADLLSGTEI